MFPGNYILSLIKIGLVTAEILLKLSFCGGGGGGWWWWVVVVHCGFDGDPISTIEAKRALPCE